QRANALRIFPPVRAVCTCCASLIPDSARSCALGLASSSPLSGRDLLLDFFTLDVACGMAGSFENRKGTAGTAPAAPAGRDCNPGAGMRRVPRRPQPLEHGDGRPLPASPL